MDDSDENTAPAGVVGPQDEKREGPRGEPSAAQAVKDKARPGRLPAAGPNHADGGLMGLDAPGFGNRSTEDLREMASSDEAEATAREAATVATEFGGMDNDLIDMGDFGEGGTGSGTQAGGAGERLRASETDERARRFPVEAETGKDDR